jgi:hypothetical protein
MPTVTDVAVIPGCEEVLGVPAPPPAGAAAPGGAPAPDGPPDPQAAARLSITPLASTPPSLGSDLDLKEVMDLDLKEVMAISRVGHAA